MDLAVNIRIKLPDAEILVIQTKSEGRAAEQSSTTK